MGLPSEKQHCRPAGDRPVLARAAWGWGQDRDGDGDGQRGRFAALQVPGQGLASLEPGTVASCPGSLPKVLPNQGLLSSLNLTNSDILTVYDGDELTARILGQYVGSSGPQKLYSSSPDLTIQFHSDPAGLIFGKGQGFIMNYIGRESGVLGVSPALPLRCGWGPRHAARPRCPGAGLGSGENCCDASIPLHIPPSCTNPQPHCRSLGQSVLGYPCTAPLFQAGSAGGQQHFWSLLALVWPSATAEQNRERKIAGKKGWRIHMRMHTQSGMKLMVLGHCSKMSS